MRRRTVSDCRELLRSASGTDLVHLMRDLEADQRAGVREAVAAARRRVRRQAKERERLEALSAMETRLRTQGFLAIAGVDEVGRGALAGPITAAAVVLPRSTYIAGLDDSKRLSPKMRELVADEVSRVAVTSAVSHVPAHVIDAIGVVPAVRIAIEIAISRLNPSPDHAITDGLPVGLSIPETAVVGGDATVASVAAASVLAKVARDDLMRRFAQRFPDWMLETNKGYGTPQHLECITRNGICPIHRKSYAPCADMPTLF